MDVHYKDEGLCELSLRPQLDRTALRKLILSTVLCIVFMIGEIIGGVLANSLAVGTDAAHLFVDLISFFISILSVYLTARKPSSRLNFGWHRAEAIGALFSIMFIWVVTVILVGLAILRIVNGEYEIDCGIMLITSAAGVILNIIMMVVLHGGTGHHHQHHHEERVSRIQADCPQVDSLISGVEVQPRSSADSGGTSADLAIRSEVLETVSLLSGPTGRNRPDQASILRNKPLVGLSVVMSDIRNINVRAAFIHVLGDMVQSIGVVIAAVIIYFKPEFKMADPICTFLFSFLVLCTTLQILRDTVLILMEACPKHVNQEEIRSHLSALTRVKSVHNLRVWTLKTDRMVASVHLVLERRNTRGNYLRLKDSEVLSSARQIFKDLFMIEDCTIQIEEYPDSPDDDEDEALIST